MKPWQRRFYVTMAVLSLLSTGWVTFEADIYERGTMWSLSWLSVLHVMAFALATSICMLWATLSCLALIWLVTRDVVTIEEGDE